jgi:uncharacterized protein YaaQ
MKLILAIVNKEDVNNLVECLINSLPKINYRFTPDLYTAGV